MTIPNPTFDFEELFQEALEREDSSDSEDEIAHLDRNHAISSSFRFGMEGKPPPLCLNNLNRLRRTPIPILTAKRHLIALLAGHPEDPGWAAVYQEGADALDQARRDCTMPLKKRHHRQGEFYALRCGISHGRGQRAPMNLTNTAGNAKIIKKLNGLRPFQRFAGFSTCTSHLALHF